MSVERQEIEPIIEQAIINQAVKIRVLSKFRRPQNGLLVPIDGTSEAVRISFEEALKILDKAREQEAELKKVV